MSEVSGTAIARTQRVRGTRDHGERCREEPYFVDRGMSRCEDAQVPVYLFTYHAYGSWMPDRSRGYVRRGKGILPRDPEMASRYRQKMKEDPVSFCHELQKLMIDEAHVGSSFQRLKIDGVATDPTHLHVLTSWRDVRGWERLRNSLRSSLTRRLNKEFGKRNWFVDGGSRKRVGNQEHYDYLVETYLPDHPGWKWSLKRGLYL